MEKNGTQNTLKKLKNDVSAIDKKLKKEYNKSINRQIGKMLYLNKRKKGESYEF